MAAGLANVNLADVADRRSATFSGGMKRRLSIALATLGSPPLLLFDEPSTGLDPLARADLLQLIQSFKRTSGIVLTTHIMGEAAALGDRVAIMAQGRLVALGSTVELTQRYGRGYLVSLTLASGEQACFDGVAAAVAAVAPAAQLKLRDGAAVTFTVPFSSVDAQLPALLNWCDAQVVIPGEACRVKEFGVSGPSLEDAFLEVTRASKYLLAEQTVVGGGQRGGAKEEAEEAQELGGAVGGGSSINSSSNGDYVSLPSSEAARAVSGAQRAAPRQYTALLTKNLTLLSRQRGLCLCQLFTPLIILGLLLLLENIVATEVGLVTVFISPPVYLPLNFYFGDFVGPTSLQSSDDDDDFVSQPRSAAAMWQVFSSSYPTAFPATGQSSSLRPPPTSPKDFAALLSVFKHPPSKRQAMLERLMGPRGMEPPFFESPFPGSVVDAHPRLLQVPNYSYLDTTCMRFYLAAAAPLPPSAPGVVASLDDVDALIQSVGSLPREISHDSSRSAAANATGFLAYIPAPHWCSLHNHSYLTTPFFAPRFEPELALLDARDGGERVALGLDDELMYVEQLACPPPHTRAHTETRRTFPPNLTAAHTRPTPAHHHNTLGLTSSSSTLLTAAS